MKLSFTILMIFLPAVLWCQLDSTTVVTQQVDSLIKVSNTLMDHQEFEQAFAVNAAAEKLVLEKLGKETVAFGSVCFNRARIFAFKKDYPEAEKLYVIALNNRGSIRGKEDVSYGICLLSLALLNNDMGNFKKEAPYLEEALPIFEKTYGKENPYYYQSLRLLGIAYKNSGLFEKAEQALLEVKTILVKTKGQYHADYALCTNSLANLYVLMGQYETAELVYQDANAVSKKAFGEHHNQSLRGMLGLANLYRMLGDFDKAEQLVLEVKSYCGKNTNGQDHPFTFIILNQLGDVYADKFELDKAEKCYLEAKEIKENEHLTASYEYGNLLHSMADLYMEKGDFEKAELLYLSSTDLFEKTLGTESYEFAVNHFNLAELYCDKGNFEKAEPLYVKAKLILEESFKKDHPGYVTILNGLTGLYEKQKRFSLSEPLLSEMFTLERTRLARAASFLSERELAIYTATFQYRANKLGHYLLDRWSNKERLDNLPALAFDNALFHKGFLLNASERLNNLSSISPISTEININLKGCRRSLAIEFAKPASERDSISLVELKEKANALEKDLARTVTGYSEAIRQVKWTEVKAALNPMEAAVEFVSYRYSMPKQLDSTFYAALVLRPGDSQPQFVPLFEENEMITRLRGAAGGGNFLKINALYAAKTAETGQKSLYELIWQPLESLLSGSRTVYCAPAGLLHRLNLSAISTPKGQSLGDLHQVVILGSSRQLVVPASTQASVKNAYLAGGIRYETDSTAIVAANQAAVSRTIERLDQLHFQFDSISNNRGSVLEYLPATGTEVLAIGQILTSAGFSARIDTGYFATEESFNKLGVGSPSPRIIHLATHGYFFPDPKTQERRRQVAEADEPVFKTSDHPMIRSGLILAGAKQTWLTGKHLSGLADGILTAYEISQMNLSSTELVVLSACETGLGDIVGNEGVYGLQRAFKIAGAKYLIISLWKVDDRSTQEFMAVFYKYWLIGKQSIPQAFRTAQQEIRSKHPDAYDWAGFVLIE